MLSSPGQFSLDGAVIKCLLLFLENSPLHMDTAVIGMLLQDIHTYKNLIAHKAQDLGRPQCFTSQSRAVQRRNILTQASE